MQNPFLNFTCEKTENLVLNSKLTLRCGIENETMSCSYRDTRSEGGNGFI